MRIPLPLDSLLGRELSSAEADLRAGIARACGGQQCISVRTQAEGSLDAAGRTDCVTRAVGLRPKAVTETTEEGERPVLLVRRGGTITVLIRLDCPTIVDHGPEDSQSPGPSPVTTSP